MSPFCVGCGRAVSVTSLSLNQGNHFRVSGKVTTICGPVYETEYLRRLLDKALEDVAP